MYIIHCVCSIMAKSIVEISQNFVSFLECMHFNPTTDSKKFVGNDTRSQVGEPYKSALQLWVLSDTQKIPSRLQTDLGSLTPNRHTSNPPKVSKKFIGWWHQVSIWRAVQISSPNAVTIRRLTDPPPDNRHPMDPDGLCRTSDGSPQDPGWAHGVPKSSWIIKYFS